MKNAGLLRYAPYQLWDYLRDKGIATVIVTALLATISLLGIRALGPGRTLANVDPELLKGAFRSTLSTFVVIGSLFAVNGIVANDRKQGYHRFLFSKPVSIPAYYAQLFGVTALGLVLLACLVAGAYALLVTPIFPARLPVAVLAAFAVVGGVGFLFSTFWRFDWLSTVLVFTLSSILNGIFADGGGLAKIALKLLPPTERLEGVVQAALQDLPIPMDDLTAAVAYGLICLALGLLHLRTRSFVVT